MLSFHNIYFSINGTNSFLLKIRFYSLLRYLVRITANLLLPIYYSLTSSNSKYQLKKQCGSEGRIIISLTSFPLRINRLWLVIESLLRQTYKPDMIILWLSKEQFSNYEILPRRLLKLRKRGLTIRIVDKDIRSHKKYYYAIQEFPNDILVTADDDIFYSSNWLHSLFQAYKLYPESVICNYGYKMVYNTNNEIRKYKEWKVANINDSNVFFGSGGGVLFPVGSLYKDVFNIDLARHLCPLADDVWLNAMVRLNNRAIVKVTNNNIFLPVLNKNDITLTIQNVNEEMNDVQIQNVISYYENTIKINPFRCE